MASDECSSYDDLILSCRKERAKVSRAGLVAISAAARLALLRGERGRLAKLAAGLGSEGAAALALLDRRIAALAAVVKENRPG